MTARDDLPGVLASDGSDRPVGSEIHRSEFSPCVIRDDEEDE